MRVSIALRRHPAAPVLPRRAAARARQPCKARQRAPAATSAAICRRHRKTRRLPILRTGMVNGL